MSQIRPAPLHAPTGDVPVADPLWELHNLTEDPDERSNVVEHRPEAFAELCEVRSNERYTKRLASRVPQCDRLNASETAA